VIAAEASHSGNHKESHIQGWIISILLHSTVAIAAILLMEQAQFTPKVEAFKWNVAMASTAPAKNQPETHSGPSTTSSPLSPTHQLTPAQPLSSPQLQAQQIASPMSERTTPVISEVPAPAPTELAAPGRSTAHTTQPAEPIGHEMAPHMIAESTSITKPADSPAEVSAMSEAQSSQSNELAAILGPVSHSVQTPTQMAAISQTPSNASTKRDYGWLSEAIMRRVEVLHHYPPSARMEQAEGRVLVKAVINEDGSISEVEVLQSSGYPALDKAAVETIQRVAPFHLPRPLGQPRVTIKIPLRYDLKASPLLHGLRIRSRNPDDTWTMPS
jgi:periplasmic protein TonB